MQVNSVEAIIDDEHLPCTSGVSSRVPQPDVP